MKKQSTFTGTVNSAYYQTEFDRQIFVTFADGHKKHFDAPYFDNALDFFYDYKYEPCKWTYDAKRNIFITLLP